MSEKHDAHPGDASARPPAELGPRRLAANYSEGGHEIDLPPNRNLFAFLLVMAVLMVLSAIGVYQLFVTHTEGQLSDAASVPASQLEAQKARDHDFATTYGKVEVEGKLVAYRVPFAEARRMVLANAAKLAPAPRPEGWIHPDDAGKK
jgi:hypothetical protein